MSKTRILACLLATTLVVACGGTDVDDRPPREGEHETEPSASDLEAFASFRAWAARPAASEKLGVELASKRRAALMRLARSNPRAASKQALPAELRDRLPLAVRRLVETPVQGVGDLEVAIKDFAGSTERFEVERRIRIGHAYYDAFFVGRGEGLVSRRNLPVTGIAVGNVLIVDEKPSTEASELELPVPPGWTVGPKTVLYMRLDFPDRPGEPITAQNARTAMATVNDFFVKNSYGKTSLTTTVTSVIRMPEPSTFYAAQGIFPLRDDALVAAAAAGFDDSEFDLDVLAFGLIFFEGQFDLGGVGLLGAKGTWLNGNFLTQTTIHELGHNYGAHHSNRWWAFENADVIGPGTSLEYGNFLDLMGFGQNLNSHFNASHKSTFDWLTPDEAPFVTESGNYRIDAMDSPNSSGVRALKFVKDADKNYVVEFRQALGSLPYVSYGALVDWGYNQPFHQTDLLDMNDDGSGDFFNAGLVVGQTFSDEALGLHITSVGKVAGTPAALDLVVNIGNFPENDAPTVGLELNRTTVPVGEIVSFRALADDSDGDALAYRWTFGDPPFATNAPTFGMNAASTIKVWNAPGTFDVRAVVSDMKGGTAEVSIPITVTGPAAFFDDFEDSNANGWTRSGGTWAAENEEFGFSNGVFSQTTATATTRATAGNPAWQNQIVTTRMKVKTFNGTNRYAALFARFANSSNHYRLALRSTNQVELYRQSSSGSAVLATAGVLVTPGSWYTVTLEVVGSELRGYVNGQLLVTATDTRVPAGGIAIGTQNAATQFDEVVVATP